MNLLICIALTCLAATVKASGNCAVDLERRVNCGEYQSKSDCEKSNCCFDDNFDDTGDGYQCFHPKNPCEMPNACLYGAECVNKPTHEDFDDGAYDCICPPSKAPGTNCRSRQGNCNIEPENRIACGLVSTFEELIANYDPATVCESRGCCFNNNTKKSKWCFLPEPEKDLPTCECKYYDNP